MGTNIPHMRINEFLTNIMVKRINTSKHSHLFPFRVSAWSGPHSLSVPFLWRPSPFPFPPLPSPPLPPSLPPSIHPSQCYILGRSEHTTGEGDAAQCTPRRAVRVIMPTSNLRWLETAVGRSVGRWKGFDAAKFIRGMCASILRAFILSTAFAVFRGRERESCEGETTE